MLLAESPPGTVARAFTHIAPISTAHVRAFIAIGKDQELGATGKLPSTDVETLGVIVVALPSRVRFTNASVG